METQTRFFETNKGLKIAYAEYGDPAGEPVIFCHGWPGSRLQAELAHEAARELGLRIIAPDRPGIAQSQFQPGRAIIDWPPLMEEMTRSLGISRYRLLGISGGAPYVLATAWANRDAVQAVAIISGAPPLAERASDEGLFFGYVWLIALNRRSPEMVRFLLRMARPLILMPMPRKMQIRALAMQDPVDCRALEENQGAFDIFFRSSREAWADAGGTTHDGTLYAAPWGFSPAEIRVPVQFWHGKRDGRFSWKFVERLAAGIPGATTHFLDDEGHNSLAINRMNDILRDLKNAG